MLGEPPHACETMAAALNDKRSQIFYSAKIREYGIRLRGAGHWRVNFCPFCGARLPDSLRWEWYQRLQDLGLEADSPGIPKPFKTSQWWEASNAAIDKDVNRNRA